jgi:long-chain acyl-CoA synthetase
MNTLKEIIASLNAVFGKRNVFEYEDDCGTSIQISAEKFQQDIKKLGTALLSLGVKNERIGVVGRNRYEWIAAYYAVVCSGNIVVPLDAEANSQEQIDILKRCGCKMLIYSSYNAELAELFFGTVQGVRLVDMYWEDADGNSNNRFSLKYLMSYGGKLLENGDTAFDDCVIEKDTHATFIFTSGTTGKSKGVILTHGNIALCSAGMATVAPPMNPCLLVVPLHHVGGLTGIVSRMLCRGETVIINRDLSAIAATMKRFRPKIAWIPPMFLENFYKSIQGYVKKIGTEEKLRELVLQCDTDKKSMEERRTVFKEYLAVLGGEMVAFETGGAPVNPQLIESYGELGIYVSNAYGMSEIAGAITYVRQESVMSKLGSAGTLIPMPGGNFKIYQPNSDGSGEVIISGAAVMQGYLDDKEATDAVFLEIDGVRWFRTGDLGRIDKDEFLYITGRLKNLIILSNGENVSPEELEAALNNLCPEIQEIMVFQDDTHNVIGCEIFLNPEYDSNEARKQFEFALNKFNMSVPVFKRIEYVEYRDSGFERTTAKKAIKRNRNKDTNIAEFFTDTEKIIRDIWCDVLNKQDIDKNQSFFMLGGDSLSVITVVAELEAFFGKSIDAKALYEYNTIAKLSKYIDSAKSESHAKYKYAELLEKQINVAVPRIIAEGKPHITLLTGSTGYLGAHILKELLDKTNDEVYCIIRNYDKYNKVIQYYFNGFTEEQKARVHLLLGDISAPHLGLEADSYDELSANVTRIFHSAADVRHFGEFSVSERVNIYGTFYVAELAAACGAQLNHISTIWVCGKDLCSQKQDSTFDESVLDNGQGYTENIYVHSKYISEVIVNRYKEHGLRVNIFRMGNLVERASDGKFQINSTENGYYTRGLITAALGCMPAELKDYRFDVTPIDKAAEAVVLLAESHNGVWHICDPNEVSFHEHFTEIYGELSVVDLAAFNKKLNILSKISKTANIFMFYLREMSKESVCKHRVTLSSAHTQDALKRFGFAWQKGIAV